MKVFRVDILVENQYQERFENVAKRMKDLVGWNEQEMLQFCALATFNMDIVLGFLESKANQLEEMNEELRKGE